MADKEVSNQAILTKLESLKKSLFLRLDRIEGKVDGIDKKVDNIGQFVATGNEDIIKKLQKV